MVTGIALVGAAGGAQRDGRALCPQKMNCDREQSTVRTFDALALGCFVGAAGLGALSAVLWTSKGRDRAATLAARAAFSGGSVGFEGAF